MIIKTEATHLRLPLVRRQLLVVVRVERAARRLGRALERLVRDEVELVDGRGDVAGLGGEAGAHAHVALVARLIEHAQVVLLDGEHEDHERHRVAGHLLQRPP